MASATMSKFDAMRFKYMGVRPEDKADVSGETGFSYEDFDGSLDASMKSFSRGDTCTGTVIMYEPKGALVDVGLKASAFLSINEMSLIKVDRPEDGVEIGQTYEFKIISDEDENGQVALSKRRLEYAIAWDKVVQLQADDATFSAEVISINRGGALVLVEGLRAFLPGSHLVGGTPTEDLVGRELQLKLLDVDKETNRLVVSNRRAMVETQMTDLQPGKVVDGVVRGVKPYGVFVDIGGMSGLLHISQISCDHIDDINTVLPMGMKIRCMIINRDKAKGRIALSTKTLEPEPGDMLKNPELVYEQAEQTAAAYQERIEAEKKAREEAAQDVIFGLESVFNIAADGEGGDAAKSEEVPFEL